jgi:Zn-dependent peptidase ImmA (M78 family)
MKTSLTIFGRKIKVEYKDILQDGYLGLFIPDQSKIIIDKSLPDAAKLLTLLHELTHAVFARAGLNQAIKRELEEVIAEQISIAIKENFDIKF